MAELNLDRIADSLNNLYGKNIAQNNRREEMIERIKACGQYIVDNADSILGTEKYITNLYVTCNFYDRSEAPYVSVAKDVVPDSYIENK